MIAPSQKASFNANIDPCKVYTGSVVRSDTVNLTMAVSVDELNGAVFEGCVYGPPFFANLMGVMVKYVPPVGSRVKLTGGQYPMVFALIPNIPAGPMTEGDSATMTDMDGLDMAMAGGQAGSASGRQIPYPRDLVAGELSLTNAMGVGVDFLSTLCRLKAGDLASVEASLLDGMVRIMSQHYRNFNAFGRFEIFRKGDGIDVIWQGSHEERDRWEKETKDEPRAEGESPFVEQPSTNVREEGRMRFTALMGHMGGFLNTFLHDPIKTLASTNPYTSNHPSGRFRTAVTDRGGLLVQSTDEIVLERVVCIPVPVRMRDATDPGGIPADLLNKLSTDADNVWRMPEDVNPFQSVFQIRQMARWFSSYHSVAKLWAAQEAAQAAGKNADWKLPTESATARPEDGGGRAEMAESDVAYVRTYATIRILRDGSIMSMCADGSAIVQGNGDVNIYAPKNYNVFAGGSASFVVGQDFNVRAARSVEVSADNGPAVIRGAGGLRLFADKGAVHLRGVAPAARATPLGGDTADHTPDYAIAGEGDSLRDYGVVLSSEKGGVLLEGNGRSDVNVKGHLGVKVKSAEVAAEKDVLVGVKGHLLLRASKDIVTSCRNWVGDAVAGLVRLSSSIIFRSGVLHAQQVNANTVFAPNVSTISGAVGKMAPDNESLKFKPWGAEDTPEADAQGWTRPTQEIVPAEDGLVDTPGTARSWAPNRLPALLPACYPQFARANRGSSESFFQPLTAQMRNVSVDNAKLTDWNLASTGELVFSLKGPNTTPYPGKEARWLASVDATPRLDEQGNGKTPAQNGWIGTPMKEASPVFYRVKAEHLDKPGTAFRKEP